MNLVNIYNEKRNVTLFLREEDRSLKIIQDENFFPYFYEPHPEGKCLGFDGKLLKKMIVTEPSDVPQMRSANSYEADILYTKRYVIDKIDSFDEVPLRWCMFDMEICIPKNAPLPDPITTKSAPYKVSCIVLYDNYEDKYYEFFLPRYKNEMDMLLDFTSTVKRLSPDLLIAHNGNRFDFPYLHYRMPGFAEKMSPIGKPRYAGSDVMRPAGISWVDSLEWWQKYTLNKEESYALEALMVKYVGHDKGKYSKVDFSKIDESVLGRCRGDVEGMVALEKKKQLIPYFDMIRRIGMVEFEDMQWNSRIIDMALLKEAKNQGVVLPMKPKDADEEEFEGAFREAFKTGVFNNVGKYDLSGAYCYAIIDFCLDSVNLVDEPDPDTVTIPVHDRETQAVVATYHVYQNPNALLPKVVNKFVSKKNELKDLKNKLDKNSPEYKEAELKYDGFKTIVLSAWGVIGNKYFRRYDSRIASLTTGIVRDLLHHVFTELKKMGYETIYIDTDSAFIHDNGIDITGILNGIIEKWAMDNFGKKISIRFDYEGHFSKLFILAKCRYRGILVTSTGEKDEVKGIEQKRKDSTKYMKWFQKLLFDKILDREPKEKILDFIKSQLGEIKTKPLTDVAKPVKLSKKPGEYKSVPFFVRALNDTPGFTKNLGEPFYVIPVEPEYYTIPKTETKYWRDVPGKKEGKTKKQALKKAEVIAIIGDHIDGITGKHLPGADRLLASNSVKSETVTKEVQKARDLQAFDEDKQDHLRKVDWDKVIDINIRKKLVSPFKALGWDKDLELFGITPGVIGIDLETEDEGNED